MANEIPDIPPDMRRLYRRLERWRSRTLRPRTDSGALVGGGEELAREHGIFPTAKALRLEYGKLKERAEAAGPAGRVQAAVSRRTRSRPAPPTFMELIAPRPWQFARNAVVELEGPRGRMKIEFKGVATAELVALSRALWDGEAIGEVSMSD